MAMKKRLYTWLADYYRWLFSVNPKVDWLYKEKKWRKRAKQL